MAGKPFFLTLLLLIPVLVWSQNETRTQNETQEELHFVQTLSWNRDESVSRYEVIIEKEIEGVVLRRFTDTPSIEVSLPPGIYQYDVIPYDVLGRPSSRLGWQPLIIATARQPELDSFSPRSFYLDKDKTWKLVITGKNLNPRAEVYLRNLDEEDASLITPLTTVPSDDGTSVELSFDSNQFVLSNYEIHITNPGGLETSMPGLAVKPPNIVTSFSFKEADKFLGVAWSPVLSLDSSEQSFYPIGASVNMSFIFSGQKLIRIGTGFSGHLFFGDLNVDNKPKIIAINWNVLMLQARFFNDMMAISFRPGAGLGISSTGTTGHINLGLSYLFAPQHSYYLEIGFDFACFMDAIPYNYLHPWIGAGLRF